MTSNPAQLPVLLAAYGAVTPTGDSVADRECCVCGELTPSYGAPAICDPCERVEVRRAYERHGARVIETNGPMRVEQEVDTALLVARSGLPDLPYHDLDPVLDEYVAGNLTRRDSDAPAMGLLIYGETGAGKSCQAMSLGIAWIERRQRSVVYRTEGDLIANLRAFENGENRIESNKLRSCDLLIIDDVGTDRVTEWSYGEWFKLFDYRYREQKHTVITTNHWLNDAQVAAAKARGQADAKLVQDLPNVDARVFRRITERCRSVHMERRGQK